MSQTITFRLGELQHHNHLSLFHDIVRFNPGDDAEAGQRLTTTLKADGEELFRMHQDIYESIDGTGLGISAPIFEYLALKEQSKLFEHSGERVTFTFTPSRGTTPGWTGGGGGGTEEPPPPFLAAKGMIDPSLVPEPENKP